MQSQWEKGIIDKIEKSKEKMHFLKMMKYRLKECNYKEKVMTFEFELQKWQINQFGSVNGAIISSMIEIACGTFSNFIAGENDSVISDMHISFIRELSFNRNTYIKVSLIKEGKLIIRTRAEMFDGRRHVLAATALVSAIRIQG